MPFKLKYFQRSKRSGKKYTAFVGDPEGRLIPVHFGQKGYEHYKDTTGLGLYNSLDHLDKERRKRYLERSAGIRDKKGRLTKDDPLSPNYYARRYLWDSKD
jgi:hypothetical protein